MKNLPYLRWQGLLGSWDSFDIFNDSMRTFFRQKMPEPLSVWKCTHIVIIFLHLFSPQCVFLPASQSKKNIHGIYTASENVVLSCSCLIRNCPYNLYTCFEQERSSLFSVGKIVLVFEDILHLFFPGYMYASRSLYKKYSWIYVLVYSVKLYKWSMFEILIIMCRLFQTNNVSSIFEMQSAVSTQCLEIRALYHSCFKRVPSPREIDANKSTCKRIYEQTCINIIMGECIFKLCSNSSWWHERSFQAEGHWHVK